MNKFNSKEVKALLEYLDEDEIQYVTDMNNTLYQQNVIKNSGKNDIPLNDIEFITKIFGFVDKFKMFHWSAVNHSMHEQIDDFYKKLDKFKDDLAENIQGISGQFKSDVITQINIPGCKDPLECINNLKDSVSNYLTSNKVAESPEYEGIRNICSGFMETIYKYIYLFRLCKD